MKKIATLFILSSILTLQGFGQVYSLDFSGEEGKGISSINGTWVSNITPPPVVDWAVEYFGTATPGFDPSFFQVINPSGDAVFAGGGFDGTVKWLGNNRPPGGLNISGLGNVRATVDLGEIGDLDMEDRVQVTYRLDGAADVTFDVNGDISGDFGTTIASQSGLNGSSLRIIVTVTGNGDEDIIYFDDVTVEQVCMPPTTPAGNLKANPIDDEKLELTFASGDGTGRIVVMREGGPITKFPVDGTSYDANVNFGDGDETVDGSDEYVVYNGTGNTVVVEGLTPFASYYVAVFEYNDAGPGGNPCYLTLAPAETTVGTGCPELGGDVVFFNEINYVSGSGNSAQGVEIAGPSGTDLSNYTVYVYDKQGRVYGTVPLSGTIPGDEGDFYVAFFSIGTMIKGGESAVALYNEVTGKVVEFISYKFASGPNDTSPAPVITGTEGVANGLMSTPLPANKRANTGDGESIQRTGNGPCPGDMTWTGPAPSSPGMPNDGQVLPIELAFFKATLKQNKVVLDWQTLTENKNDFMAVERSADAVSFQEIGRVAGAGDSFEAINYSHIDFEPLPGINYYRIRQVDFDGQYSYTKIVSVLNGEPTGKLAVFPSVTTSALQVQFGAALRSRGELRIFDLNGRLLYREPVDVGAEATTLDLPGWAPGTYLLQLQDGRDLQATRFVKVD